MGNNRSNLVSGSTATTASLNSTSSLPVNPMSGPSLQSHTNSTQSSVSFLKRFRNPTPASHNSDELDNIDSNLVYRKKNKKLNTFSKKLKKPDSVDDFTESNRKSMGQKKMDKTKIISLSTSNLTKNSKVSTNESEYTTINEYIGDTTQSKMDENKQTQNGPQNVNNNIKEESFYESTFDMDLPNSNTELQSPTTSNKETNKENDQIQEKRFSKVIAVNSDKNNSNIYSEVINRSSTSKTLPHGYFGLQPLPPVNPPPHANSNKKKHLQPITNFFKNKLTKTTTKSPTDYFKSELSTAPAPAVPAKAFNPSKEFYNDFNPNEKPFDAEEIDDEEDDDEGGIYSKIDKSTTIKTNPNARKNIPPLPTTLIPTTLLIDDIESCLSTKSSSPNYNEYQFVQEYEYIEKAACSPLPKTILYTPIEPLNINNQVYYSFTSDSQEQFDLQNEFISRIDVKPSKSNDNNKFTISFAESDLNLKGGKNSSLINEIENSRNQVESSHNYTVKL